MSNLFPNICTVCGGREFIDNEVLWPTLINAWQLSENEVSYINRQQGLSCKSCGNNLRSMALAKAILITYAFPGVLSEFVESNSARILKSLEINEAGGLTPSFNKLPNHKLVKYPDYDMTNLAFENESFDLIIHSDTLEHVPNPIRGLAECQRVLSAKGKCIFTVPIIVDRLSRSRAGLTPSYHGQSEIESSDQVVFTEFGTDIWQTVLKAGFRSCEIFSLEYPAALAIIASK